MKHTTKLIVALLTMSTYIKAQDPQDPYDQIAQLEKKANQLIPMFKEQSKQISELSDSILKLQEQLDNQASFEDEDENESGSQKVINLDDEGDTDEDQDEDMLP